MRYVLILSHQAGLRNKPNYNPMQYSIEWANVITGYLKKQLLDIALPIAPRLGLNIKQTFKGILSDPDSRERWVSKFIYTLVKRYFRFFWSERSCFLSLDLLRVFYSEVMIDHATFLMWLVQTFASCNLAQAGFIARLVDDYLPGISASRALLRPLMESCLSKCSEVQQLTCLFSTVLKLSIDLQLINKGDVRLSASSNKGYFLRKILRSAFLLQKLTVYVASIFIQPHFVSQSSNLEDV